MAKNWQDRDLVPSPFFKNGKKYQKYLELRSATN